MNAYTTVTQTSWFSRIKSAVGGIIIGPICIILAVWLLWYNEGRSVERAQDLALGIKLVQEISSESYNPSLDSKLVHISGTIQGKALNDPTFGVTISGAILERNVEMYQWREKESTQTKENLWGGTTTTKTYSYEKTWSTTHIDSDSFAEKGKYINPTEFAYASQKFQDADFQVGAFHLSQDLIGWLPSGNTVDLSAQNISLGSGMTLQQNQIFIGNDTLTPQIGDMRVSYNALNNGEILSIIAGQNPQAILSPYQAKNKTLSRISLGTVSAQEMFSQMQTENKLLTWGLRVGGLLLMFIGWSAFFSIIPILGAFLPLFGKILWFGTWFIALMLTLTLGGTVIILAWIFARPLFAILWIFLLVGLLYFLWKNKKEKSSLIPVN